MSEKSPSSHSKQLLHHVLKNILKIDQDERVSFSKWMEYNYFHRIHELCHDLQFELNHIHDYYDYIVNGQHCALNISTMNKSKLLISLMPTIKRENRFQLSSQYLLSLTYQDFNKFRQEDMIQMTKAPTTQTPSTTKPILSRISGSKTKLTSLPHSFDPYDESVCQSAEENPLLLDELKSPPSLLFQSSSNPFELSKPTKTSIPNQPWKDPV